MEHPEVESLAARTPTTPAGETASSPPSIGHAASGRQLAAWDDLPPGVRLRVEHHGKWVAWSPDGETVVVAGDSLKAVLDAPEREGTPGTFLEWLGD